MTISANRVARAFLLLVAVAAFVAAGALAFTPADTRPDYQPIHFEPVPENESPVDAPPQGTVNV